LQILKDILNDTSVNSGNASLREWVNRLESTTVGTQTPSNTTTNNTFDFISLSDLNTIKAQYEKHPHNVKQNSMHNTTAIVKSLQILLNAEGGYYTLKENGVFDSATYKAVCSFQARYGLTVDGIVGNETWNALYSVITDRINSLENCRLNINNMFDYAKLHWNNYNTAEYHNFNGEKEVDCCNYVSQILIAGGLQENDTWHGSLKYGEATENFTWIQSLTKYLCNNYNIEYRTSFSINDVEVGDCIVSTGGTHIVFVIGVNKSTGQIFFTGHTNDRYHGLDGNDNSMSFYYTSMLEGVLKTSDICLSDNPYYKLYGESYLDLFENKSLHLINEPFFNLTTSQRSFAFEIINNSSQNAGIASYLYSLENGLEVLTQSIFAKIGWGKTVKDEMRLNSINYFMQELCKNENFMNTITNDIEYAFSNINGTYSLSNSAEKAKFIEDLADACESIPYSSIEEIVNYMCGSSIGVAECIEKKISHIQYITANIQLAQIEISALNEILRLIDPSSDIYSDLNLLKSEMSKNWLTHFKDYLFTDKVQDAICSTLEKAIVSGVSNGITGAIADISISILVNHIYKGELADDIVQNLLIYSYVRTLENVATEMRTAFMNGSKTATIKNIKEYETIFSAYLASLKILLETANNIQHSPSLEAGIDCFSDGTLTYDNYIKGCIDNAARAN